MSKARRAIDWSVYRPRNWGTPGYSISIPRPWFGLDTERDADTGEFVCCWIVGDGSSHKIGGLFDGPPGTYWVYNLGYDLEGLLRDLDVEEGWAARIDGAMFPLLDGKARYFHGKRFDFKNDSGKWIFLEASSFNGRRPLHTLASKTVGSFGIDASSMSLEKYLANEKYPRVREVYRNGKPTGEWEETGEYGYYRDDVDLYCENDAEICLTFIEELADGLDEIGVGIASTPGGTARNFLKDMPPYPRVIWRTHKDFLRSYCGGRFEICKRGILFDVYQYDLVSAYPWALSKCPWLTSGAFHRAVREYSSGALYGSYRVSFSQGSDEYLGIAPCWRDGTRVYSRFENDCWLTRPEIEWLLENDCDFEIKRGVEIFDDEASSLWEDAITKLFKMKQSGEFGWGPKIVLNSQYGILIQLNRMAGEWVPCGEASNPIDFLGTLELEAPPDAFESGRYYAPVYAGHLTALVRCRILDAAKDCGYDSYIGGHTDSVLCTKPLSDSLLGNGLGDWQLEKSANRAEICKTGMYAMDGSVKMRGITRKGSASMLWSDEHSRKTRIGIKTAKSWSDVSRIVRKDVANNYAVEIKRDWEQDLDSRLIEREEWIDSRPLANVGHG